MPPSELEFHVGFDAPHRAMGVLSPFYGYLQSLPTQSVDIADLWDADDQDSTTACQWITGTELERLRLQRRVLVRRLVVLLQSRAIHTLVELNSGIFRVNSSPDPPSA
jgi:hypothetical protein